MNTARGAICDTEAVKEALESGHLAGYAGATLKSVTLEVYGVPPLSLCHPQYWSCRGTASIVQRRATVTCELQVLPHNLRLSASFEEVQIMKDATNPES